MNSLKYYIKRKLQDNFFRYPFWETCETHTLYSVISGASPRDLLPSMSYGGEGEYATQSMREYLDKNKYIRLYP